MMAMAMSRCSRDPRQAAIQPMAVSAIRAGVKPTVNDKNSGAARLQLAFSQQNAIASTKTPSRAKLHCGMRSLPTTIARSKITAIMAP